MRGVVISGSGLYQPPQVITNAELVESFNAYVERFNAEHTEAIAAASIACLELLSRSTELRDRLHANTRFYREGLTKAGLTIKPGTHPITPIMVYDAVKAQQLSARLLELGVYAVGFFFPVVPKGQARIRVQLSAAHTREHLDQAIAAFTAVGRELGVVK